jgi:hypothetical protein
MKKEYHSEDLEVGWEYNIKMDLKGMGWGDIDCIDVAQDRDQWRAFVSMVMNPPVP